MSEPMFFCASLPAVGEMARLQGDEAHHAIAARRLKTGDELWLFDGHGGIARANFHAAHHRGRELEAKIAERRELPPPRPPVHLACALPKGDRAAVLLDMATQLGITSFTPLLCERSVVDPGPGTLDRLRRVCLEACKQSRRAHLPTILAPTRFADVVASRETKWIAHPDGESVSALTPQADQALLILIGPEGGFTDAEVALALASDARRVALGAGILRVETAAVALLGAIRLSDATAR